MRFFWEKDSLVIQKAGVELGYFENIRGATPITSSRAFNSVIQAFDPHTPDTSKGARLDGGDVVFVETIEGMWVTFDGQQWHFSGSPNFKYVPPYVHNLSEVTVHGE